MKTTLTFKEAEEYYNEYQQYLQKAKFYTDKPMTFSEYIYDSEEEIASINDEMQYLDGEDYFTISQ